MYTVSSIVLLLILIGHNMVFISFRISLEVQYENRKVEKIKVGRTEKKRKTIRSRKFTKSRKTSIQLLLNIKNSAKSHVQIDLDQICFYFNLSILVE